MESRYTVGNRGNIHYRNRINSAGVVNQEYFYQKQVSEIDEPTEAEKSLAESEARFRLLNENASIGICQTTPDGRVLLSDMALHKILGCKSFDELKEKDIEKGEFYPAYSHDEFKMIMKT